MPHYIENHFLNTAEVARMVGRTGKTVKNWMLHGVTVHGVTVKLQYQRSGRWYQTTREWLDQFMTAINVDTPPLIETTSQRQRRAEKAAREYRAFKNR